MNGEGVVVRKSNEFKTTEMSGAEFIRGTWQYYTFGYEALEPTWPRLRQL